MYIFRAVFDILYATESVRSHSSIEPIFDEIFTIFPPTLMCLHSNSVINTVPVTFTSKVFLKLLISGSNVSKSGPIPALLIRKSIFIFLFFNSFSKSTIASSFDKSRFRTVKFGCDKFSISPVRLVPITV